MKMSKGQVFRFGFVKGRFLATAVLALSTSFLAAFELDLKGSIKNVEGEELNEVEVIILGSKLTASSDSEGNFQVSGELTDPELLKNIELVFKKEGYLTKHRSLAKSEFEALSVRMMPSAGSVTDIDGNSYQTVSIGKQEWTVRNLRVTSLNDGTAIKHVKEDSSWVGKKPHYCYLHNNPAYAERFGALYNWYAIDTGKLAPIGWRVATENDWAQLEQYLIKNLHNFDQSEKGNKLAKSLCSQTSDWPAGFPLGLAGTIYMTNNSSGFSAFPSGARGGAKGNFVHLNEDAYWWTSTEKGLKAVRRNIFGAKPLLNLATSNKSAGMSVRLVRDDSE